MLSVTVKRSFIKYFSVHVNTRDDEVFKKITDWWNPYGTMKTLHSYNDLRMKYILESLKNENIIQDNHNRLLPLTGLTFLDIGSGGGILCESIARLGGNVVGIDSNITSHQVSTQHLDMYENKERLHMKSKVKYFLGSVDDYHKENPSKIFDVITAMEVIEHVNSHERFIKDFVSFIKPDGYLFLSTINKTFMSYIGMILFAEKVFSLIAKGAHEWEKFISPERVEEILKSNGLEVKNVTGVAYNPLTNRMFKIHRKDINYILYAKKKTISSLH